MVTQYYRITAYNEKEKYSVILDVNGKFEKLWQFSIYVRDKGFKILAISSDENFSFGNLEKIEEYSDKIYLRATKKGMPDISEKYIDGTLRKEIRLDTKYYIT